MSVHEALAGKTVLITGANRGSGGGVIGLPEEDVRDLFEVHTFGPLRQARGLAPGIRARRGGMISVHSTAALSRNGSAYSASTAAGMMLALAMREALMGDGVRVTSVFPDRFAELVHEQLQTGMDGLLDDPGRVMTALVQRYAAGG